MTSRNKVQENIQKIRALFPNAVTEVLRDGEPTLAVDFDILKQEMSDTLIDDKEQRYQFTWPDKNKSILLANTPISATLRPCKEESVDFDNTQNLYIEGDNLEVLKLLQETYLGKIKMIYIDPPYNTGNDFVYNDDFAIDSEEYLNNSGQYDEQGNRLMQNKESNGRFHTDWLNMIYPRLRLAKDLLSDDGVIFISIDDNEVENLRKICDEIFGEINFVASIIWKSKSGGANDVNTIACDSEYVLVFAKNIDCCSFNLDTEAQVTTSYNQIDPDGRRYSLDRLDKQSLGYQPSLDFPIEGPDGKTYVVEHKNPNNKVARWRWSKESVKERYDELVFKYPYVYTKNYEKEGIIARNLLIEDRFGRTRTGKTEIAELFDKVAYFSFPKPTKLIKYLIGLVCDNNDIILDFFSGSATTAHAVMKLNAEYGGNRKYIMVQLPEPCDEKSEAYKAGYKNICEIGKERIRRSGRIIQDNQEKLKKTKVIDTNEQLSMLEELTDKPNDMLKYLENLPSLDCSKYVDTGFRVLKLDSSNMKDVYYRPEDYNQSLLDMFEDNIKEDRTPLDLLFQVMLDLGKPLSAKIEEEEIAGKHVFIVDGNDLIACFDKDITDEVVKTIAQMKPLYAVFRDSSMANDSVGTNFEQIFATYSPNTTRKVL